MGQQNKYCCWRITQTGEDNCRDCRATSYVGKKCAIISALREGHVRQGYYAVWENDDFDYTAADEHEILEHILSIDEEAAFYYSRNEKVSEDLQNTLNEIQYLRKPLCVYADGLNVMDDVGGYGGYIDFLETIHGADRYAAKEMRDWARQMGWTGRTSKPENML